MYLPIRELIERYIKNFIKWYFVTCLFSTKELKKEADEYLQIGRTSFHYFGWLNPVKMRQIYPRRWKIIMLDFAGAYFKLILTGSLINTVFFLLVSMK